MDVSQKVLWHEGMFLVPQQFQQADRYHGAQLRQAIDQLRPGAHGLFALAFDEQALATGQVLLRACSGILPDGLAFDAPGRDQIPAGRPAAAHFPAERERLGVHLAVASLREGANTAPDGVSDGRQTRYRRVARNVADDNAGDGERREIAIAEVNLRLLFDGEGLEGQSSLHIADLGHSPTGGLQVLDSHVGPCLRLAASGVLTGVVRRLLEILIARSKEMSLQRRQRTQGMVEFSVSETASFLMLHTVNASIPVLSDYHRRGNVHPETVFLEFLRLAGALSTFSAEGSAADLPIYDHEAPLSCFQVIEARVRAQLERTIATRYIPLPMTRSSERVQSTRLPEGLEQARMYLAVASSLAAERVMKDIPLKAKVASASRVGTLIAQAVRGITLTYLSVPPAEVPAQPGNTYFEVQRTGEEWDSAIKTRTLAISLPPEYADARVEFLAVRDSQHG